MASRAGRPQRRSGAGSLARAAAHEGVLTDAEIVADLGRRHGPHRSWSVSRLNRFGACPYSFWAQYTLKLEAVADPGEGMNALQRGSLVHKILEVLFARLAREGLAPRLDALEQIAALLDEACDQVLPRAAEQYGFRPGPLWDREQRELRQELQTYMAWECEPEQAGSFRPFYQELKFGLPGSGYGPVEIVGLENAALSLHGVVDRIDRDDEGRLRVIDYKTGSKTFGEKDIAAGRALQSALYAWAVDALMGESGGVADTVYRHTGTRKQSGAIRCHTDEGRLLIAQAAAMAVRFAGAAREGRFSALPSRGGGGKACSETCDFLGLCRVTRHGVRKAQRHGSPVVTIDGTVPAEGDEA